MSAMLATAASVIRTRRGSRRRPTRHGGVPSVSGCFVSYTPFAPKAVSRPANGLDGTRSKRAIDLLAEKPNVDVHDVRVTLVREVPHVLEELASGDHLTGMPHEELEDGEFLRCELDRDTSA